MINLWDERNDTPRKSSWITGFEPTLVLLDNEIFEPCHLKWLSYFIAVCPSGAICDEDVKVKANFWGEEHNNEIFMHICPDEYCCQHASCDALQSCAPHR